MGIYDRGYYDGDQWKGESASDGPSSFKRSVIAAIILINVGIFLIDMFSPKVVIEQALPETGQIVDLNNKQQISMAFALKHELDGIGFPGPLENPLCVYQLLTYGFAHASIGEDNGLMHVLFNMLGLFFLGMPVEQKYGKSEFLKFYLLALLFSGAVWLGIQALNDSPKMAVGASGAVAAVVMLFVLNFPKQTIYLMGVIPMRAWVLGILFVGMDILNSFDSGSRIAVEAHLAGVAFAAMYFFGKWNFQWMKFGWLQGIGDRMSGKPKLKVHTPEEADPELARQADMVLDKLHRLGEENLTRKERKVLERFSKTVRKNRNE